MANQLKMKLLVDTNSKKVLFAEASKDVVDFLFNLLAMPLGAIIKLLTAEGMVGCIGNLYKSVAYLDESYIQNGQSKASLLNPVIASPSLAKNTLFLPATSSDCSGLGFVTRPVMGVGSGLGFGNRPPFEFSFKPPPTIELRSESASSGFVKGVVTYTVMDDLSVMPMSTISTIGLLNNFRVKDMGLLEERMVVIGMKEGLEILKASLQSKTVLTDVFLREKASASE